MYGVSRATSDVEKKRQLQNLHHQLKGAFYGQSLRDSRETLDIREIHHHDGKTQRIFEVRTYSPHWQYMLIYQLYIVF